MSEETAVETKCSKCEEAITNDEVLSTDDYESLCSDCYNSFFECACCSELTETAAAHTCDEDGICRSCLRSGNVVNCQHCDLYIITDHGDYRYDDHSDEYCCDYHSDSTYMSWSCEQCSADVLFESAGTEYSEQFLCYDCYHNPQSSIQRISDSWLSKAEVHLDGWYSGLDDGAKAFIAQYYNGSDEEYKGTYQMVKKGPLGAGSDFGWWDGKIEVSSPAYAEMARVVADLCYSDLFFVKHKKYGLYHPFRHIFHGCLSYRDRVDDSYYNRGGRRVNDPEIAFEMVTSDHFRYELYSVRHQKLATFLTEGKTEDGANLRKTVSNIMTRSYADRFKLLSQRNNTIEHNYQQYLTNAVNCEYKLKIGFNSDVMSDLADFNSAVGSCQEESNKMSYGWGFADMLVNPNLLALLYEGDKIIGRSVIRFFKHNWDDESEVVKIAPSRLYLSRSTNAKNDVYVAMFKEINRWAKTVYDDKYKLIAYADSRHDSSIYSYLRSAYSFEDKQTNGQQRLLTQVWNVFWHSKPQDDCADYTYYKDEMQRAYHFGLKDGNDFAVRESVPDYGYRILELD